MISFKSLADIVVDFFYPARCAGCDKILNENEINAGFCTACRSIISLTKGAVCLCCGKPLGDSSREYCRDCEKKHHEFAQGKAVYEYTGIMKDSMYRFKYSNRRSVADAFAKDAVSLYGGWIKYISPRIIVPVPMFERKKKIRGYNQAEVFANSLSKRTKIPWDDSIIVRSKDTKPLKTQNPRERKATLQNAFSGIKRFNKKVDVLLVDDIFTTGATVDEVALALKQAGAGEIYCLFICSGKKET